MTDDARPTLWSQVRVRTTGRAERPADSESRHTDEPDPGHGGLSHTQMVDRILTLNPSASSGFLDQFEPSELWNYLRHLLASQEPRGRTARWSRPDDSPAIMHARRRT